MSLRKLKSYIKKHGKAKTAVALGLVETNAISNWVSRKKIPIKYRDDIKYLANKKVVVNYDWPQEEKA